MQFRTDLAIEVADEAQHLTDEDVGKDTFREGDTCVTRLHIRTCLLYTSDAADEL